MEDISSPASATAAMKTRRRRRKQRNETPATAMACLWEIMLQTEYDKSSSILDKHPEISPKHRAMVLIWEVEICQGLNVPRDTYFTARDILDRFLLKAENVRLLDLQLVAVAALFIAAKVHKERPAPCACRYAIMADGVYSPREIINCEKEIGKVLNWKVTPITVVTWTAFYITVLKQQHEEMENKIPSKILFNDATRLLHLSMLDCKSLNFKSSIVAASALYLVHPRPQKINDILLPNLDQDDFFECLRWMADFNEVLSEASPSPANDMEQDVCHLALFSTINLNMLEKALNKSKST